jgi:Nuclease A inhibitor-like protein
MPTTMARSTAEIIALLTSATADLFWTSETDAPFEVMLWKKRKLAKPIVTQSIDDFFQPAITPQDWYGDDEQAIVARYISLIAAIKENLSEVQVDRVGEVEITIYIIGKTPDNTSIALKTSAVET